MKPRPEIDIHDLDEELALGVTLIEASAGTGKTYTIAAIFLRLIVEHGLRAEQILVTTFTKPATAELRDRIRRLLREALEAFQKGTSEKPLLAALLARYGSEKEEKSARLRDALRGFDQAAIDTIHAFCQRALTRYAFESGAAAEPEFLADESELLHEVACDYWRSRFYLCAECLAAAVRAHRLSVGSLAALLRDWTQQPSATWRPAADPAELEAAQEAISGTLTELRHTWQAARAELEAHFFTANAWAKRPFNDEDAVRAQLGEIGCCLEHENAPLYSLTTLFSYTPEKLAEGTRAKSSPPVHAFYDLCAALQQAVRRYALAVEADFLAWAPPQLRRRKERANLLSYGDLLTRFHAELHSARGDDLVKRIQGEYRAALIDEFQDTDPLQDGIFACLFGEAPAHWLFLIGDPKQAIYGFRGADVFTYLTAAGRAAESGRVLTLGTNFRSTTAMVGAVNTLFSRSAQPFVIDRILFEPARARGEEDGAPFTGDGLTAPFRLRMFAEGSLSLPEIGRQIARSTAAEIARLLAGGGLLGDRPVQPSDIAILTATNDQAQEMQEMLGAFGIPSALLSSSSVFESREARELLILLQAISRPTEAQRLRAALLTETLGLTMHEVAALAGEGIAWEMWSARFHAWHELWRASGFIAMFRRLVRDAAVRPRLLARPDGERRLTNFSHLSELLQAAATEEQLTPAGVVQWLGERLAVPPPRQDGHELRLERDDDAVRLVTVHKSKGLQYNIVFCPFAWKGVRDVEGKRLRFHDATGQAIASLSPEGEPGDSVRAQTEQLAEEVRLLYVALTRARHRCDAVIGYFPRHLVSATNWLLQSAPPAMPESGDLHGALEAHYKGLQGTWQQSLEAVVAASGGALALTDLPSGEAPPWHPPAPAKKRGKPRAFRGSIERDFAVSSFTSLTQGAQVDAPERSAPPWTEDAEKAVSSDDIHAFPAGARSGICLHEIFERLDFTDLSTAEKLVAHRLADNNFDAARWTPAVLACVRGVLATPLPGGLRLEEIPRAERLIEREFHLPARRLEAAALRRLVGGSDTHPLDFRATGGWLKGFIDLIFRHEGRYYIIDWKSNRLGPHAAAYSAETVSAAMDAHHYPLQAQLYTVALHRYLRQRLPEYDYEQHFGGMTYLFVRGLDPATPAQGVWHLRPERDNLEALSAWLEEK